MRNVTRQEQNSLTLTKKNQKMLKLNKCTKAKPKPTLICKNCSRVCVYHCVQPSYTTQHRTVLTTFPLILQTRPHHHHQHLAVCVCVCEPWFAEHKAESLTRLSYSRSVDDRRQLLNVLSHHLTDTHTDIDTHTQRQTERLSSTQRHCCVSL